MATTEKLDLYKQHKDEYVTPKRPTLVKIGPAKYLTIEGRGEPGGAAFQTRLGALYAAAFTIKMTSKFAGCDYAVCKLEGLWWADDGGCDFASTLKDQWRWKLMIRTPDFIRQRQLDEAIAVLKAKGKDPAVADVKLETLKEGRCVQMLHVGSYDAEAATIAAISAFAQQQGLAFRGRHHEIYLSDPRRVAPEKLRTILRHPAA